MPTLAAPTLRLRRYLGVTAVLIAVLIPWAVAILQAHEVLPGSVADTNRWFGLALAATYVGGWLFAIVVSRSMRLMSFRATGTTLTLALILLLLEMPAMLHWVHWRILFRTLSGEGVDYQTAYVLDDVLSFRRIPGLHWSGRPASDIEQEHGLPRSLKEPITFTYDRWGYRNATEMEQADIVLLGDSYVEGWYVSDEQTVAAQLADRLGRPVASLGVAGYGTLQTLKVLTGDAWRRGPKTAVWFFFEGNDLYDDQVFENAMVAAPPSAEEMTPHADGLTRNHGWAQRSLVRNAFHWIRRWSHPLVPNRAPFWADVGGEDGTPERIYFANYGAVPWTGFEEQRWAIAQASFEEGLAFARERGIELLFVYVPTKYRVYRDVLDLPPGSPMKHWTAWPELPERFHAFCASAAARCVDLTELLQQSVRAHRTVYAPTDTHWSPEGHALVATELEDVLHGGRGTSATPVPHERRRLLISSPLCLLFYRPYVRLEERDTASQLK